MDVIWLGMALLVGATVGGLLVRGRGLACAAELTTRLHEETARGESALAERDAALAKHSEADRRCRDLEGELLRDTGALNIDVARLETLLEGERSKAVDQRKTLEETQAQMVAVAKESAVSATTESAQALLQSFEEKFKTAATVADADLAKRQKSVEETVRPVAEALTRMETALTRVDEDRRKSHIALTEQLRAVNEAHRELRTETGTLSRALRQPQTRGRWGELHLRRLVEVAGMSGHCDFVLQNSIDDDGRVLRPDMVVTLPGDKDVVVDSKAPLAPYLEACEATDETQRKAHLQMYARGLRVHIKKLAAKDYSAQFDSAPDFVVLYLPGEHFLGSACETDPEVIEFAAKLGVLIATPTTLIVLLKTIAHAWQQERVAAEAQAIAGLGRMLYDRLCKYLEHADLVGKRLNSTVAAHNSAIGSMEHMVLPMARKFPELGAVAADKALPSPRTVDSTAREVQARELRAPGIPAEMPAPGSRREDFDAAASGAPALVLLSSLVRDEIRRKDQSDATAMMACSI